MTDLLSAVLDAHGGLERWRQLDRVEATIVSGGGLWAVKGQPQDPTPRRMSAALHREWASVRPFGADDQKTDFTPQRIAIEKLDGRLVSEQLDPRQSFAGHDFSTPWNPLQRAYFNGYALWTYLTTPFLLAMDDVAVREIDSVSDGGETWRGLQAVFPPQIASHSRVQEFYVGDDYRMRRHDYRVDVAGGFPAVQYVSGIVETDGIRLPTIRRAYRADANNCALKDQLMVAIDLSDISFY
ncbi:MAG: hypothetical protein JWR11_5645 [Mycobacterium sp.]|nr:hypothetical protein [Mycobacterium sp.]